MTVARFPDRLCRRECWSLALFIVSQTLAHSGPAAPGEGALRYLLARLSPFRSEGVYYETGDHDRLRLRQSPLDARYIPSFEIPKRSPVYPVLSQYRRAFVYDMAVSTCALLLAGKHAEAKGLLRTLECLQLPDGGLGFSFNAEGDSFYNYSYLRSGAVAWAGYAAALYQRETGDRDFEQFADGVGKWLLKQQVPSEAGDPRAGLIRAGYGQWSPDYTTLSKERIDWCCTEHAIDSFFLFRLLARTTGDEATRAEYMAAAERLKNALMGTLWTETTDGSGRFFQGVSPRGLDRGEALDCCTWGALFLIAIGENQKAERALWHAEKTFRTPIGSAVRAAVRPVRGYRPYAGVNEGVNWDNYADLVWSEGALGCALAYLRLGRKDRFASIVTETLTLCARPGDPSTGVRYSRYRQDLAAPGGGKVGRDDFIKDFTQAPSVCATAWLLLVQESAKAANSGKFWGQDE